MARTEQEERNVRLVRDLFEQVLQPIDADAVDRFIAPDYIQHNQWVDTGREPLKAFLRRVKGETPDAVHDIKRVLADGDHVVVHYHLRRWPGDRGWAVIDIFRIADGMVCEHWDVVQDIPADSPNPNPPF